MVSRIGDAWGWPGQRRMPEPTLAMQQSCVRTRFARTMTVASCALARSLRVLAPSLPTQPAHAAVARVDV